MSAKSLNATQQKIVEHCAPNIIVAAGPGSGKTHVIVSRIQSYLDQGYFLSNFILLTFTKQAALNMMARLEVDITPKDLIGTFHSVALKIIIQNAKLYPHYAAELKIFSDYEKSTVMLKLLREHKDFVKNLWLQKDIARRIEVKTTALNYINNCTRNIGDNYEYYVRKYPKVLSIRGFIRELGYEGLSSIVRNLLQRYFDYLDEHGLKEFDDLLHIANKLLVDTRVKQRYQGYIHKIFVDELQDIDKIQSVFLLRLRALRAGFFMVGDDDQAIYGFRGAFNCFKDLSVKFRAKLLTLSENHRSNKDIVRISNIIISLNEQRVGKDLISYKDPIKIEVLPQVGTFTRPVSAQEVLNNFFGSQDTPTNSRQMLATPELVRSNSVMAHLYRDTHEVVLGVALTCKEILAKNLKASIAILFRWNNQSPLIEKGLLACGLAYSKAGVSYSCAMLYLINFVELLLTRGDEPFKHVSKVSIFDAAEYSNLLTKQEGESLYSRAQQMYPDQTKKLVEMVNQLNSLAAPGKLSSAKLKQIIDDILKFMGDSSELQHKVLTATEKRMIENLSKSSQEIGQGFQELPAEVNPKNKQGTENSVQDLQGLLLYLYSANAIQVSTIHASKGKEYDYVFLVGNQSLTAFHDNEEERRIFYVALTRARHCVYIAHSDVSLQNVLKNVLSKNS